MKNLIKLFALAIVILGFSATSFGQDDETAVATGTIVTPISIAHVSDMAFGNVASSGTAGSVKISTDGVRTPGGGATLPATTGTFNAASFTVSGFGNSTYTIAISPASVTATVAGGGGTPMTVGSFESDPSASGVLNSSGSQTVNVGATLTVNASQPAGNYTTSPFTVTVAYN